MGLRAHLGDVAIGGLLAVCLGCSSGLRLPESSAESAEYFSLSLPGSSTDARLDRDGISGPEIQLTRYQDALRGRAYGMTVELYWTEDQVNGSVGGAPVELTVEQGERSLSIKGLYAGKVGNFRIQPDKIEGTIGGCTYSMETHSSGSYAGHVSCGGGPMQANLSLPASLPMYQPAAIAAYLAVFLGR